MEPSSPHLPVLGALDALEERVVVLTPHVFKRVNPTSPRVVGPGRRERAYLERVSDLELALADAEGLRAAAAACAAERARSLEIAGRVDRGAARRMDKLESAAREERVRSEELAQRERRLILALGALQRENEMLRERLTLDAGVREPARLDSPQRAVVRHGTSRHERGPGRWQRFLARLRGA